jgi:hypothetical protein
VSGAAKKKATLAAVPTAPTPTPDVDYRTMLMKVLNADFCLDDALRMVADEIGALGAAVVAEQPFMEPSEINSALQGVQRRLIAICELSTAGIYDKSGFLRKGGAE